MAVLLAVCEIFMHIELENSQFRPLYSGRRPPGGGTLNNVNIIYTVSTKKL